LTKYSQNEIRGKNVFGSGKSFGVIPLKELKTGNESYFFELMGTVITGTGEFSTTFSATLPK
jgi:hypothetical protein